MTSKAETTKATRRALEEAASWRCASLLFERPRPGWHGQVRALLSEAGDAAFEQVPEAYKAATEGECLALLGPSGPVSPREVSYLPMEDPGIILGDIRGFYEAFAYEPRNEEPIDHVATEAGFVAYMKLKLAYALERGDHEAAEVTSLAIERFLESHLAYFAGPLADRIAKVGESYLLSAARVLSSLVGPPRSAASPASYPFAGLVQIDPDLDRCGNE